MIHIGDLGSLSLDQVAEEVDTMVTGDEWHSRSAARHARTQGRHDHQDQLDR